jgi:hypothetical protein
MNPYLLGVGLLLATQPTACEVVKLTEKNYDTAIHSAPHFIKYYAPW